LSKAVLFDLDGTLVNTLPDLAAATNAVLEEYGYPPHPVEAYRRFVGNGARKQIERALGTGDPATVERVLASYLQIYDRMCLDQSRPYPYIDEVIEGLQQRGYTLLVVTNKPQPQAEKITRRFFGDAFAGVFGGCDRYPKKPDPASPRLALEQVRADPAASWFVGDSDVDVITAKNAGLRGIGAGWGFRGEDELRRAGASRIAHAPLEVLSYIDGASE
jgi:phosphoglycolate phosphatase